MSEAGTIETVVGPCLLKRSDRTTLAISVLPDGTVELVAPRMAANSDIAGKVEKKARWITRQRRAFKEMNGARPPLRFESGATHRYLGRQYRLKVGVGADSSVKLRGAFFHITTPDRTEARVKELLSAWLRQRATEQFSRRLEPWREWCANRGLPKPRLHLRTMPKRWGSSHRDGRIFLNPDLVRAPSACIDYVITHEICHLEHRGHDKAFFRLLAEQCPNWRMIKLRLEKIEIPMPA